MFPNLWLLTDRARQWARRRRWDPDLALGRDGEDRAHRLLAGKGYVVVARNWRTVSRNAEVDLVAWDGAALVFVEVKTRRTAEYGAPERAVDAEKRWRIGRAALEYCVVSGYPVELARFDLVSVVEGPPRRVEHLADAYRPAVISQRRTGVA